MLHNNLNSQLLKIDSQQESKPENNNRMRIESKNSIIRIDYSPNQEPEEDGLIFGRLNLPQCNTFDSGQFGIGLSEIGELKRGESFSSRSFDDCLIEEPC